MDLEDTLASLKLNETPPEQNVIESEDSPPEPRRSTRLKSHVNYSEKRRVLTRPTKLSKDENTPQQNIDNYYLDKRIKRLSPSLETIYEDGENAMSLRKFKRILSFNTAKCVQIKKRKMKVKSVPAQHRVKNRKKIPLAYLLEKLEKVDE